jgi:hypothetical protein
MVVGVIRQDPRYPSETPIFEPCGREFTIAQSHATEKADAEKAKRAGAAHRVYLKQLRKDEEKRSAEFSRQEALRKQSEVREQERRARLEPVERLGWVVFWLSLSLVSGGAVAAVCFSNNMSPALLGAAAAICAFSLFRLLIVGFDPPFKPWEDLYVTFVYGVLGLIIGALIQLFS